MPKADEHDFCNCQAKILLALKQARAPKSGCFPFVPRIYFRGYLVRWKSSYGLNISPLSELDLSSYLIFILLNIQADGME